MATKALVVVVAGSVVVVVAAVVVAAVVVRGNAVVDTEPLSSAQDVATRASVPTLTGRAVPSPGSAHGYPGILSPHRTSRTLRRSVIDWR
jgi:hypothetical protein